MPLVLEPDTSVSAAIPSGSPYIGAWNEPLMLTFGPLPGAAAGNTAVLKLSEAAAASAGRRPRPFPNILTRRRSRWSRAAYRRRPRYWNSGGISFFSPAAHGRQDRAPGGGEALMLLCAGVRRKEPDIVHSSAEIKTAARRIAIGRSRTPAISAPHPDHVLVWPDVKDEFVATSFKPSRNSTAMIQNSPDYGRIINRRNSDRLAGLLDSGTVAAGGQATPADHYLAPTCSTTFARFPHHAGGVVRPDPSRARNHFGRGGHRMGQRRARPAGP